MTRSSNFSSKFFTLLAILSISLLLPAQTQPDTWVAKDGLGRSIESIDKYGPLRKNKTVGMFFVIWHGAHGYDNATSSLPDENVMLPTANDSLSPYDIQKLIDANPDAPQYGPVHAFHHWGEPYLGYYVANDEWVIRKHAQMLSDAGVDVIIIDITNAAIYLKQVIKLCEVYSLMRQEGNRTPQISFILNTEAKTTLKRIYDNFYAKNLYKDLWFYWKGKPLILCPPEGITSDMADFFTVRHSWFCSEWDWFGDGKDKWPWADLYPQKAGWHDNPETPECVAVSPATHPIFNYGRSYHKGKQPEKEHWRSGEGLNFTEQFEQAMRIDPEFIFFAGWNEWMAMRFNDGGTDKMMGKPIKKGDSYFVDLYNHEYSRDIEPLRGNFGDAYYYQLVDFIRRFKGVNPAVTYSEKNKITLNGDIRAWDRVKACYEDDRGDVFHRDHFGYGRIGRYTNNSGRNDFITCKIANDGKYLYFYTKTDKDITPWRDKKWMRLFINVEGVRSGNWEGFQYMVNNQPANESRTSLDLCRNGWNWERSMDIAYRIKGDEMIIAIPMNAIGIKDPQNFTIEFKWIDNAVNEGDIQECLSDGDTAPNGRFRYRYTFRR